MSIPNFQVYRDDSCDYYITRLLCAKNIMGNQRRTSRHRGRHMEINQMTQLYKHPILQQCYDVTMKIEACGGSPELTTAVIASSQLMQDVDKLVDECERRTKVAENIWHSITSVYGPEGFMKVLMEMDIKKRTYDLPPDLILVAKLQKCNDELRDLISNIQDGTQIPDLHEDAMKIVNRYKS